MFRVIDGDRILEFSGEHLAHASSRRGDSDRWVEFDIYRTDGKSYIVARVGWSVVYHRKECPIVARRGHQPAQAATLTADSLPCVDCRPSVSVDFANLVIYPEKPLYWAMAYSSAADAVDALAMEDDAGNKYYTNVARTLIREAAAKDESIQRAYSIERIA